MIRVSASYKLKPQHAGSIDTAIVEFVRAISENEPQAEYRVLKAADGLTYLHLMAFPNAEAQQAHEAADYTRHFVESLAPRCEAGPDFTALSLVAGTKADME